MSTWSTPSIPRPWRVGIGLLCVLLFGYFLIIAQQLLLGLLFGVLLGGLYLSWRFVAAVEAIADALQRLARQQEQD
jgi:hypothetical protein